MGKWQKSTVCSQYLLYRKVTIINKIIIKFTLCFCQLQLHFLVDFVRFGDG